MNVFFMIILPLFIVLGMVYFFALRVASRSTLIFIPLIGSLIVTVGFILWGQYSISTSRSSTASIGYLFLPIYALIVALAGFAILWSLHYLARFIAERWIHSLTRLTSLPPLILAILVLLIAGLASQTALARHQFLNAAASTSTDADSRQKILDRALSSHDLEALSALATNVKMPADDLTRIYDVCKNQLTESNPPEYIVFMSLARNPRTPPDILDVLANSRESTVRTQITANPNVPQELLHKLANDPDKSVQYWAKLVLQSQMQRRRPISDAQATDKTASESMSTTTPTR